MTTCFVLFCFVLEDQAGSYEVGVCTTKLLPVITQQQQNDKSGIQKTHCWVLLIITIIRCMKNDVDEEHEFDDCFGGLCEIRLLAQGCQLWNSLLSFCLFYSIFYDIFF